MAGELSEAECAAKLDVSGFLAMLASLHRWRIGVDQHIAVHSVILRLIDTGEIDSLEALKWSLGPIVCSKPQDQRVFCELFDGWFAPVATTAVPTEAMRFDARREPAKPRMMLVAAVVLVAVAIGIGVWLFKPFIEYVTLAPSTDTSHTVTHGNEKTSDRARSIMYWPIGGASVAILVVLSGMLVHQYRRRIELRRVFADPEEFEQKFLSVAAHVAIPTALRGVIRYLRMRRAISARDIDPERTVVASSRRAGLFTPVYSARRSTPEYLVLIDRAARRDHVAGLMQYVVDAIAGLDVQVSSYEFQNDPRVCWRPGNQARVFSLTDLMALHRDTRLVLITDGVGLADPYTSLPALWIDALSAWHERVVLTPRPPAKWGARERMLRDAGLPFLPAEIESLSVPTEMWAESQSAPRVGGVGLPVPAILERAEWKWVSRREPEPSLIDELCSELRASLGPRLYKWLTACAVYPSLHAQLTMYIGHRLELVEDFDRDAMTLARLPWFRLGWMPDWLRLRLLQDSSREEDRQIRTLIEELLKKGSGAFEEGLSLSIATKRSLAARVSRFFFLRDLRASQRSGGPLMDQVLLDFLSGRNPRPLSVTLPAVIQRLLRPAVGKSRPYPELKQTERSLPDSVLSAGLVLAHIPLLGALVYLLAYRHRVIRWHAANAQLQAFLSWWLLSSRRMPLPYSLLYVSLGTYGSLWVASLVQALRRKELRLPLFAQVADILSGRQENFRSILGLRLLRSQKVLAGLLMLSISAWASTVSPLDVLSERSTHWSVLIALGSFFFGIPSAFVFERYFGISRARKIGSIVLAMGSLTVVWVLSSGNYIPENFVLIPLGLGFGILIPSLYSSSIVHEKEGVAAGYVLLHISWILGIAIAWAISSFSRDSQIEATSLFMCAVSLTTAVGSVWGDLPLRPSPVAPRGVAAVVASALTYVAYLFGATVLDLAGSTLRGLYYIANLNVRLNFTTPIVPFDQLKYLITDLAVGLVVYYLWRRRKRSVAPWIAIVLGLAATAACAPWVAMAEMTALARLVSDLVLPALSVMMVWPTILAWPVKGTAIYPGVGVAFGISVLMLRRTLAVMLANYLLPFDRVSVAWFIVFSCALLAAFYWLFRPRSFPSGARSAPSVEA